MSLINEETIEQKAGGGGIKDTSDKLGDMKFAEKLICTKEVFDALARQPILTNDSAKDYKYITVTKDVLVSLGYGGQKDKDGLMLGSAMQRINSVLVALKIPYRALTTTTSNALVVEKTVKRGEKTGETKTVKIADKIKVYRYGDKFDVTKYAAIGCGVKWKDSDEELDYEEPTEGVRSRAERWLTEVAVKEIGIATLKKVGVDYLEEK